MFQVILFVTLFVFSFAVDSSAACTALGNYSSGTWTYCNRYSNCSNACTNVCGVAKPDVPDRYVITGSCEALTANATPLCGAFTLTTSDCDGRGNYDSWGRQIRCTGYMRCDTKCEADSVACIQRGQEYSWISGSPCGRCQKNCHTRSCCDSLNITEPLAYDTTELGCKSLNGGDYPCVETPSYDLSGQVVNTTYQCDGVFYERVCTTQYTFSGAGQCVPLPTTNCVEITNAAKTEERCKKVSCVENWENEMHSLTFNGATECYEGTYRTMTYMVCSNGDRTFPTYSSMKNFKVCQDWLVSHGTDISGYLGSNAPGGAGMDAAGSPVTNSGGLSLGTGVGGSGGGGIGNGGGGTSGGSSGDGSGGSGGSGGEGTDEPYIGPMVPLTEYDSATGEVTIVRNSQGGDSLVPASVTYNVRCLGVSNGIATMTDGRSTWTCSDVQSCVQAELKYKLGTGCGGNPWTGENNPNRPQLTWNDSVTHENGQSDYTLVLNNISKVASFLYNFFAFPQTFRSFAEAISGIIVAINSGAERNLKKQDSIYDATKNELWKATFGNDLSNVVQIKDGVWGLKDSVHSVTDAVNTQTGTVAASIGNASTDIRATINSAVNSASSRNSDAIASAASVLQAGNDNIYVAITSASSRNSDAIASASSVMQVGIDRIYDAINSATSAIVGGIQSISVSSTDVGLRDTLHNTNTILESIEASVVDTGKTIPASIWSLDSTVSSLPRKIDSVFTVSLNQYADDRLKIVMDSNAARVVNAIDSLKLDVKLDSITLTVPHDSILDSIDARLQVRSSQSMQFVEDTLDLGKVFSQAFEESKMDTNVNLDSSVVENMRSQQYIDGTVSDPTNVDSVENVINRRLDSSNVRHNARSDSMVRALADSAIKYSGLDSGGAAVRRFFTTNQTGCPRECLNITLQIPNQLGGGETQIKFADIICDRQIIGSYTVLDFLKLVLRIMTAYLSLMFVWNAMFYLNVGGKKK